MWQKRRYWLQPSSPFQTLLFIFNFIIKTDGNNRSIPFSQGWSHHKFSHQVVYKTNATLVLFIQNPWLCNPVVLLFSLVPLTGSDSWAGSIGQALTQAKWQSVPDCPFQLSLPWEIASHSCSRILTQSTWLRRRTPWCSDSALALVTPATLRAHFPVIFSFPLSFAGDSRRHCRTWMKPINKAQTKAECQRCWTGSKVTH